LSIFIVMFLYSYCYVCSVLNMSHPEVFQLILKSRPVKTKQVFILSKTNKNRTVFNDLLLRINVLFCIFCFHRAIRHSSATLPEVFSRDFSSFVKQMPGCNTQRQSTARTLPKLIVLLCVLLFV